MLASIALHIVYRDYEQIGFLGNLEVPVGGVPIKTIIRIVNLEQYILVLKQTLGIVHSIVVTGSIKYYGRVRVISKFGSKRI